VVEHDMAFVRQIAEQVTVLHFGKLFAEGSIDEITANEEVQSIYLGVSHDAV
jgi:branched-chain amino acid transport system ATP-binding protein